MFRDFAQIQQNQYDLIIIGGGINGAGVARDAALRGLKTILLEKGDFSSGTSSWSTRLIHGGLRYLEYFEFSLVREALKEREVLLQIAPHLVKPLLLTIPIYRDRSRPYWKIWAGMLLYDFFSYNKTLPMHRMLNKVKFQQLFRSLDQQNLVGGAQYYDGQITLAERLCLENIIAAQEAGATVLNYVEVTQLQREKERVTQVTCRDKLTGESFAIACCENAVVINTAGPWVDQVCNLGNLDQKRRIGGTKGSHIIVKSFPGAPNTSLYVEAKSDGRPFFIVPWLGKYLIGTTDLPFQGDLDKVKADNEEIDYLLQETNNIIVNANLSRDDILYTYSGVRPLPNIEGNNPGAITRKHFLYDHKPEGVDNLISLIGGKLTTYRHVSEVMVNAAMQKMGRKAKSCQTAELPLPGYILPGDRRITGAMANYELPGETINYLFEQYGAKALEILALTKKDPDLASPISSNFPDIKAQIVYAVRSEFAHNLVDILCRRTMLAMNGNYGLDLLSVISATLVQYCGWTAEKCDRDCREYQTYMEENAIPDYCLDVDAIA
ncbi:MAG: glycerol-3-phosphate dehydrogenase [Cyanobacteria bacterium P01_F01_bin.143]